MNDEITRREALKQGAIFGGAALVWVRPSVQSFGMSATLAAQASGTAGCTPGFWKKNPEQALAFAGVDTGADLPFTARWNSQPSIQEALEYGGGGGDAGAERNLLRAAAAGYINANALSGYALGVGDLTGLVSEAQDLIAAGDREGAMAIASSIDVENNAGCPIPAYESGKGPEDVDPEEEIGVEQGVYGGEEDVEPTDPDANDPEEKVKAEKKSDGDDE